MFKPNFSTIFEDLYSKKIAKKVIDRDLYYKVLQHLRQRTIKFNKYVKHFKHYSNLYIGIYLKKFQERARKLLRT